MNAFWDNIYGHKNNKEIINRILTSSAIPHAFLFIGKQGIGKDYFAIQFAKSITRNLSPQQNQQQILNGLTKLSEPYLKFIFSLPRGKNEIDESNPYEKLTADELDEIRKEIQKKILNPYHRIQLNKANTIKVSSIRDINKFLSLQFEESFYRFILISDAHLMNETSQNALLKNLEEPPDKVIFILTTPYPDLLRETIRSRCWSLFFNPLSTGDITSILIEFYKVDKSLARDVAAFSDGSISNAIQLLDNDFKTLINKTINFLRYALGRKFHSAYAEMLDIMDVSDTLRLKLLIQMIIIWLNDLQKFKYHRQDFYFSDYVETLDKFNKKFPRPDISNIVFKLDYLSSLVQKNINPNLLAANVIYTISGLTK